MIMLMISLEIMLTATQLYPEIEELALGHLREALRHYERKSEVVIISIIRENLGKLCFSGWANKIIWSSQDCI